MASTIDLMDNAWSEIANNGSKMFDDDFMFGIFKPIIDKIPPFEEYMNYMFEERTSYQVGGRTDDKKVRPWKIARRELMYPTRRDIIQASELSHKLAVVAAVIFCKEFRDKKKATAKYLSAIDGSASMGKMSDEYLEARKGIEATNNASKRLYRFSASVWHNLHSTSCSWWPGCSK